MKVEKVNAFQGEVNFLKTDKIVSFSEKMLKSKGIDVNGRKIIKAGTIYPANDATAKGIVLYDVDVTGGDTVGALMVEGYVIASRLHTQPDQAAKTALKEIKFV